MVLEKVLVKIREVPNGFIQIFYDNLAYKYRTSIKYMVVK
jgi:hypothetical protein